MHWFFALTEASTAFRQYAHMIMVAVQTAREFTWLVPHCIYDGSENDFTRWLEKHDVRIVEHRSFLHERLVELGDRKGNPHFAAALSGAFSRVELPELTLRVGSPARVLYTDCDVVFRGEVVDALESNDCNYFAVAPESVQDDFVNMNTGVMLMNMPRLRESLPAFRQYIMENLESLESESWDEAAYRRFYRDESGPLWDRLPVEFNWKPYWGQNEAAKIIHFHGPKPFQRPYLDSHWPELKFLTGGVYHELCDEWEQLLRSTQD